MPGFMYFTDTTSSVATPDLLSGLGLSHITDSGETVNRRGLGPGGSGLIFCAKGDFEPKFLKYDSDSQTWIKCDSGRWWIGFPPDHKPTPADLKRAGFIGGHTVMLEDGCDWAVPVITALPGSFSIQDGEISMGHVDRFAPLRDDADRVFQKFLFDAASAGGESGGIDMTRQECFDIACRSLAVNYRVSMWEVAAMGALTTDNVLAVLEAILDIPTLIEVAESRSKKNGGCSTPKESDMSCGSVASPPDTNQPTPTSTGLASATTGP